MRGVTLLNYSESDASTAESPTLLVIVQFRIQINPQSHFERWIESLIQKQALDAKSMSNNKRVRK